jgi:catechol 2,3-dioxygenase-like lactoylglutathione lyase family enzyme
MSEGIAFVSIAVADMQVVRALWLEQFGLSVLGERTGADPEQAALWNIPADDIQHQLLLGTPGAATGRLHFVELRNPGPPIRATARPFDLCAKNVDVNCSDLPAKVAQLKAAGYEFRSEPIEYELHDVHAREVQMPAHDGLNIAFIDVLSDGYETPYTDQGYASLTSFVVIVADIEAEVNFYRNVIGFDEVMYHRLSGPDIETAIGLPPGAALQMHLLGRAHNMFGRMEVIHYEGLRGTNLFERAVAPATGVLNCGIFAASLEPILERAQRAGIMLPPAKQRDLLCGTGRYVTLHSPAGLNIQLIELDHSTGL